MLQIQSDLPAGAPWKKKPFPILASDNRLHRLRFSTHQFFCHSNPLEAYECDRCAFKADLKTTLASHLRPTHKEEKTSERTPLKSYYVCENCNFQTYSLLVLTKHLYNCNRRKRRYNCEKCPSSYSRKDLLRSHIVKKHADLKYKWFKCEECTYQTMYSSHLYRHRLRKHSPLLPELQCEYCTYKTKIKDNLHRHVKTMHGDPNEINWHQCELCPFKCEFKRGLARHKKRQHTPLVLTLHCTYCTYLTNIKADFETHKKIHTELCKIKLIECELCSFKCKRKDYLIKHKKMEHTHQQFFCHSTLRTYKCNNCNFRTDLKLTLMNHQTTTHKQVKIKRTLLKSHDCEKCNFQTFSSLVLTKHWYDCNKQIRKPDERPYKCQKCTSCYKRKDHLKNHVLRKHSDLKDGDWFKCNLCRFQTIYKDHLHNHTLTQHSSFIVIHKCEYCPFKTKNKDSLKQHRKGKHSEWKKCELCPYKCGRKSDLDRHVKRIHTPLDITLRCTFCTYTTNIKGEWQMHFKTHADVGDEHCDEKFKCEQCLFETVDKRQFKRHMRRKHTGVTLHCELCPYNTAVKDYLRRHVRRRHTDVAQYFQCQQCSHRTKTKDGLERHTAAKHLNAKDITIG